MAAPPVATPPSVNDNKPIGILGGTFDPIHYGHLRPALEILEELDFAEIRFIPSRLPPHRSRPGAAPAQRLELLRLAVADQPGFVVDERELRRDGPSYTVDTLTSLRAELGATPLCLILGMDAFSQLTTWRRWRELSELAHLVVTDRPDSPSLPIELLDLIERRRLRHASRLRERPAGGIWLQPVTQLAISATRIRELLAQGRSVRYLLPDAAQHYIQQQGLYSSNHLSQRED